MDKEKIRVNNITYYIDNIVNMGNIIMIVLSEADFNGMDSLIAGIKKSNDGIIIYTRSGIECGTINGYNTIYRVYENKLYISNDGSVYVEPSEDEQSSEHSHVPTLQEIRDSKIQELSDICNQFIEIGVGVEIDGGLEYFSYKTEDQNNIKDAFDLAYATHLPVPYHADGQGCKLYSPEQILTIYVTEKMNLTHHTTYFNQLKMFIETLEDQEFILSINYGYELKGEYLDNYNDMMRAARRLVESLINVHQDKEGAEE